MFIETILIQNGRVRNIRYHQERFDRTRQTHFNCNQSITLRSHITLPTTTHALVKCRITYGKAIEKVEYEPYNIKPVHTLQCVYSDTIDYDYKKKDRSLLAELMGLRGGSDDILIVKNGYITDTYYANVALLKQGEWYTPTKPLLRGTRRAQLLQKGKLKLKDISVQQLCEYSHISLINAMIPLGKVILPTDQVVVD